MFAPLRRALFGNSGAGPKLRPDIVPIAAAGSDDTPGKLGGIFPGRGLAVNPETGEATVTAGGWPLLHWEFMATTVAPDGCIRIDADTGLWTREQLPEAVAEVHRRYAAGDAFVVTEAAYQTDFAANGGVTQYFSIGDGTGENCRFPIIGRGLAKSAAWPDMGLDVADCAEDRMRPIEGSATAGPTMGLTYPGAITSGALASGEDVYAHYQYATSGPGYNLSLNSALLGDNYDGLITHGPRAVQVPWLKVYGAVTAASEANMAALVNGLAERLPTERYETDRAADDAMPRVRACGSILADGTIEWSYGITACAVVDGVLYNVTFSEPAPHDKYTVLASTTNALLISGYIGPPKAPKTTTQCGFFGKTYGAANAAVPFTFAVIY
ncbi:MAG: hypothetical protein DELT_01736 [Desulfovibrio sp.]